MVYSRYDSPVDQMIEETFEREDYEARQYEDRNDEDRFWTEMGYVDCPACNNRHHVKDSCQGSWY